MLVNNTSEQIENATGTVAASVPDAADRKSTTDGLAASGPTLTADAVFRIPEDLTAAEKLFWSIRDRRDELETKLEETGSLQAIVRLAEHVEDLGHYCLRGSRAPWFPCSGDIRRFFEPYLSCDPQGRFARDRLALLEAHAAESERVHAIKLQAGVYETEALESVLYEQEAVVEDYICDVPCHSIEDVHRKVQFALLVLNDGEAHWESRDRILRSIQSFTAFAAKKEDDEVQVTGLQVAALNAAIDQLG
jgi:hypothetical protein